MDISNIKTNIRDVRVEMKEGFKNIRSDMRYHFRMLLGGIIFIFLCLGSLLTKGFNWF